MLLAATGFSGLAYLSRLIFISLHSIAYSGAWACSWHFFFLLIFGPLHILGYFCMGVFAIREIWGVSWQFPRILPPFIY